MREAPDCPLCGPDVVRGVSAEEFYMLRGAKSVGRRSRGPSGSPLLREEHAQARLVGDPAVRPVGAATFQRDSVPAKPQAKGGANGSL